MNKARSHALLRAAVAALQDGGLSLISAYRLTPSPELKVALLHLTVSLRNATQQMVQG